LKETKVWGAKWMEVKTIGGPLTEFCNVNNATNNYIEYQYHDSWIYTYSVRSIYNENTKTWFEIEMPFQSHLH
jgi:hypothetical protein